MFAPVSHSHQRDGLVFVDQRGGYTPYPVGRVGGVGEVELAEVYAVGQFYPQNLIALGAFVDGHREVGEEYVGIWWCMTFSTSSGLARLCDRWRKAGRVR